MNKYKVAKKIDRTYNNIIFLSKKEMLRYKELLLLEKIGKIKNIELQPKYELQGAFVYENKKQNSIIYKADFRYYDNEKNKIIVEDTKGYKTRDYIIKKKLLLYKYPEINFKEV